MLSRIIFCLVFSFAAIATQAQEDFNAKFLSIEHGIPSNEVYHVVQDHNQFLWFATDNGIFRYDGKNVRVFNMNNGLTDDLVFKLYPQKNGRIYGTTRNNQLFYIEDNAIFEYQHNDLFETILKKSTISRSLYVDSEGTLHLGFNRGKLAISAKGQLLENTVTYGFGPEHALEVIEQIDEGIVSYTQSDDYLDSDPNKIQIKNVAAFGTTNNNYAITIDEHRVVSILGKRVVLFENCTEVSHRDNDNYALWVAYIDGKIWMGEANGGATQFDISDGTFKKTKSVLANYSVTSILKDHEDNFWFTTREAGVAMFPGFHVNRIYKAPLDQNISALLFLDSGFVVGFEDGRYYDSKANELIESKLDKIASFSSDEFGLFIGGQRKNWTPSFGITHNSYRIQLDELRYLYYGPGGYSYVDKSNETLITKSLARLIAVAPIQDEIVIATADGLEILDHASLKKRGTMKLPSTVVDLIKFKEELWVVCRNGGLYRYTSNGLKKEALQNSVLSKVLAAEIHREALILSTDLGVYKFRFTKKSNSWVQFDHIDLKGIVDIQSTKNKLIYLSRKSVFEDLNSIHRVSAPPKVSFDGIIVNRIKHTLSGKSIELEYYNNNFEIQMHAISLRSPVLHYKYRLLGHNSKYRTTSESYIQYSALEPGKYTIQVMATTDGVNYSQPTSYVIVIHPPFWKEIWFIVLSILLVIGVVLLFYVRAVRKVRSKMKVERKLATLRSQALMSQLNPHLVFNIMNTIQGMIADKESEQANYYLASFSRFMRLSLNLSKHIEVSIWDEIEITEHYLELEGMRFTEGLQFQLDHSGIAANTDCKVPPLIIQPIIENAIKHGVSKRKSDGIIAIRFEQLHQGVAISVVDNGSGFNGAAAGDGLRICKERLTTLNERNTLTIHRENDLTHVTLTIYENI